jgi:hypothetical protein
MERCITENFDEVFRSGTKKREKDNAEARRAQRYAESWHAKARVPVLSLLNRFNHGDLMMTKLAGGARMRTFGGLRK